MAEVLRPPIVTILGHVDHGKTTLLDFIRKSSVAAKEHGGITQHIGAYQIEVSDIKEGNQHSSAHVSRITFIDTPGHSAFEKMRSRGAGVADIAVLVVAVDDGIMPQTVEAIKHIQLANVSMIVAINKIDIPGIDVKIQLEKIKRQLSDRKILVEEYGGDVPIVPLSAKTGEGVDKLLEIITLVAEINELKGDPQSPPQGVVIESSLDKSKGAIATILVRNGTLKKGDQILVGGVKGKIRNMFDFAGQAVDEAGPSTPVEVIGLEGVPAVGSILGGESTKQVTIKPAVASLLDKLKQDENEALKVVIKADKQGSLEAIENSLEKFNAEKKSIDIVASGIGEINESDIKLADSVKAIVVGFSVKVAPTAQKLADNEHILIRTYNIIYELLDEMEEVIESMIRPGKIEEVIGKAEIVAEFPYGKNERISGCRVVEGTISKGPRIRVVRNNEIVAEAKIKSLKKVKEEVNKVEKGQDCGIMFDTQIDFQVGDIVESYRVI